MQERERGSTIGKQEEIEQCSRRRGRGGRTAERKKRAQCARGRAVAQTQKRNLKMAAGGFSLRHGQPCVLPGPCYPPRPGPCCRPCTRPGPCCPVLKWNLIFNFRFCVPGYVLVFFKVFVQMKILR